MAGPAATEQREHRPQLPAGTGARQPANPRAPTPRQPEERRQQRRTPECGRDGEAAPVPGQGAAGVTLPVWRVGSRALAGSRRCQRRGCLQGAPGTAPHRKESPGPVGEGWKSSGTGRALRGALGPRSPSQPGTHLALIRHLVGRGVLLHDVWSQDLETPSELGQEQAIRIPWGQTDGHRWAPRQPRGTWLEPKRCGGKRRWGLLRRVERPVHSRRHWWPGGTRGAALTGAQGRAEEQRSSGDGREVARRHPSTSCGAGDAPGPAARVPLPRHGLRPVQVPPDAGMLRGEHGGSHGSRSTVLRLCRPAAPQAAGSRGAGNP